MGRLSIVLICVDVIRRWNYSRTISGFTSDDVFAAHLLSLEESCNASKSKEEYIPIKSESDDNLLDTADYTIPQITTKSKNLRLKLNKTQSCPKLDTLCELNFKCDKCDKSFMTKRQLQKHSSARHSLKQLSNSAKCDLCALYFENETAMKAHRVSVCETISVPVDFTCIICGGKYKNGENYRKHIGRLHGTGRPFECPECHKMFKLKKQLNVHRRDVHSGQMHFCQFCGRSYKTRTKMLWHEIQKHGRALQRASGRKRVAQKSYDCAVCGQSFKQKQTLESHTRTHTAERVLCDLCGKVFQSVSGMVEHRNSHDPSKQFKCDHCEKVFSRPGYLRQHKNTMHLGKLKKRKYSCELCDKTFTAPNLLQGHMNTHSGTRPHGCTHCDKAFYRKTHLQVHIRMKHLNEQSYYKRHKLKNIAESELICKICGKRYTTQVLFKGHMDKHSGIKAFSCDTCAKTFYRRNNLKRHMELKHSNNGGKPKEQVSDKNSALIEVKDCNGLWFD